MSATFQTKNFSRVYKTRRIHILFFWVLQFWKILSITEETVGWFEWNGAYEKKPAFTNYSHRKKR
jgi:hypothetical protein